MVFVYTWTYGGLLSQSPQVTIFVSIFTWYNDLDNFGRPQILVRYIAGNAIYICIYVNVQLNDYIYIYIAEALPQTWTRFLVNCNFAADYLGGQF